MKKLLLGIVLLLLSSASAEAKKTTYIATNHRFNAVKLQEVSIHDAEARAMSHPADIDEVRMREILSSIKLSRAHVIKKEADTQQVFDEPAIEFLAPNLTEAFRKATSTEEVLFSYLSKYPEIILRNDRLTLGSAWIHDDALYMKFKKLYAKVTGDTDRHGGEAKEIARARGLRVVLEISPGQRMSSEDPETLIVPLHPQAVAEATSSVESETEEVPPPAKEKKTTAVSVSAPVRTAKDRLEELEGLKKDGLITKKEYEEKRKEILKEL